MYELAYLRDLYLAHDFTLVTTRTTATMSTCVPGNDYDGRMGTRISSIFVILVGSFLGTWFPVFASRRKGMGVPAWAFFVAKYFGSGVIVATAFIHVRPTSTPSERSYGLTQHSYWLLPTKRSATLAWKEAPSAATHGQRVLR